MRPLTDDEKEQFRQACIAGVNPLSLCPRCMQTKCKAEQQYHYCGEHLSWERAGHLVTHPSCGVRFTVGASRKMGEHDIG